MALSFVNTSRQRSQQLQFNSDEASVASSHSASSSVVTSSPAEAASRRHGSSLPKEHDYIGLSEVSSAPSSSPGKLHNSNFALDDTDLSLGLGLGTSLSQSQKANACAQNGVAKDPPEPASDALSSSASKKRIHHRSGASVNSDVGRINMKPNSAESADHGSGISSTADARQNMKFSNISAVQGESCGLKQAGSNTHWSSLQNSKSQNHGIQYIVGNPPPQKNNSQHRRPTNEGNLCHEAPPRKDRVVGWPPVRSYRRSALAYCSTQEGDAQSTIYVKVNMDGIPIGRKIDLNSFNSYEALLSALEGMFSNPTCGQGVKLLNGLDYILTYEDKEGDWMLVGDVPWEMFVSTVRRLRIMRGSDASSFGSRT